MCVENHNHLPALGLKNGTLGSIYGFQFADDDHISTHHQNIITECITLPFNKNITSAKYNNAKYKWVIMDH